MQPHSIVSREQWIEARKAHMAHEKELTQARERLAEERRRLPWVRVDKTYVFGGPNGEVTLADMFKGRPQLVVQHVMFAPDWDAACKSCSLWADGFERMVPHLAARDTSMAAISLAPVAKLEAFKKQKLAQKKPRTELQQSPPPRTADAEPTPTPALAQPPSPPASSTRGVGPIPFGQGAQHSQTSPAEEPEEGPVRNSSDASAVAPADPLKQANEFREPPKVDLAIRGPPPLPSSGIARRVFPLPPPLSLARSNQASKPPFPPSPLLQ